MSETPWHQTVLLVGATSGIARALAERLAEQRHDLLLAGRDHSELESLAADLHLRFRIRTAVLAFDAQDPACHATLVADAAHACSDTLSAVVLCHGIMLADDTFNPDQMRQMIEVNYTSCVTLLEAAGTWFAKRGQGLIVAISSVAGDRGRPSNYRYGSTKAALTAYLQGLSARLARSNVHVLTVKPGIVATPMTWGLPVKGPTASPQRVARDITRAMQRQTNVLYTPWFWRPIMALIRTLPEPLFKRLNL